MRAVRIQDAVADLFKAAGKLHALRRRGGEFNRCNAVSLQADINQQLTGVVLNRFSKKTWLKFCRAHAHIPDHGFHQRKAPQRFRNG